jgi:NADH pyrophosphatase NudC (nudix superfamily)
MTAEEAIKELRDASDNEVRYGDTEHHYNEVMKRIEAFDMAIKALEQQPTRPTGKWESFVEDYNKCSKCGEMGKFYRIYKYCPNCGARMEKEA